MNAPAHAELTSVGTDEVVVTFVTEPGREVVTTVGDVAVVTRGPYHDARVGGLEPGTEYRLHVEGAPVGTWLPGRVTTLARPPGRLRAVVATANDVHFGETECGRTGDATADAIGPVLRALPGEPPYPELMGAAVVAEMLALDPDAVVVKGDLTDSGRPEEYRAFLDCYGALGARFHHVRGNHDAVRDPDLVAVDAPYAVPVDGAVLAVVDTTVPGACGGALPAAQRAWLDELAAATPDPVFVFAHHPAAHHDRDYSIGDDARPLVELVRRRENVAGWFAGHTHTNRVAHLDGARGVPFVEVACAKDFPGAWAEYRIYDGGYTQVMRRVAAPAARAWSERARTMIQGVYRDLVLGAVAERCFSRRF